MDPLHSLSLRLFVNIEVMDPLHSLCFVMDITIKTLCIIAFLF